MARRLGLMSLVWVLYGAILECCGLIECLIDNMLRISDGLLRRYDLCFSLELAHDVGCPSTRFRVLGCTIQ